MSRKLQTCAWVLKDELSEYLLFIAPVCSFRGKESEKVLVPNIQELCGTRVIHTEVTRLRTGSAWAQGWGK